MGAKKNLDIALKVAEEGAKIARAEKKAMRMSEALDPHVGKRLYITQADRMALDPTKGYLGGSGFIDLATMLPEYKGMAWAVKTPGIAKTMVGSMARNPEEAIWTNLQGSPAQHRSNQVVFDKIMSEFRNAVEEGKLTPELRNKINKKLASIKIAKTDIPMFPSDVDILSPDFAKQANVFHKRREIASVLGGEGVGGKKGTIIPYEKIIEETTDPLVKDVQTGSIGNRLFSLTGDIFPERPDIHTAYPTALGGEKLSDVFTPAPQEIVLKEVYKDYKRKPTYYDLTRGHAPSAKITDEMLEDLYKSGYAGGGAIKGLQKAIKAGEKAVKEIKHTIPEAEQPFIGYIKKSGDHESYSHDAAKAVDYHHSHLMKDPDAMFADDALTFVRYQGEPIFTIKGESALDPYHPESAKHISTLAELLKRNGADPNTPLRIEDLALPREEAPYQGKQIGTLQDWIDIPKNKYAGGGPIKALDKALKVGERAAKETLKKAKDYKPTKGKISEVKDYIRDTKGEYGAQRVERAADLVPNLEKQYSVRALREAFDGDNAKSVMVMNPADYEKYARQLPEHYGKSISGIQFKEGKQVPITIPPSESYYDILTGKNPLERSDYTAKKMMLDEYLDYLGQTARGEGLLETPYLMLDESLNLPNYRIAGHEGRHRSRALAKLGDESTLIRLLPRGIREGLPRGSQEEYQQGLQELLGPNPKVYPEHTMVDRKEPQGFYNSLQDKIQRPLIELPEFFAEGGTTADGGSSHKQGKPLDFARGPRSKKSDIELLEEFNKDELTAKDYLRAAPTIAKTTGKMLKEQAKEELPTYLEPRAIPDIALNALATGVGSISDLAHLGTGVERPVLGSEQLMDVLKDIGVTSGTKRPLAENLLTVASPKVLRTAEQGLNKLVPIARRSFTPLTTTVEAVAPDLAKFRPRDFQEYVTNRMISNEYGGVPTKIMGDRVTSKSPAQGVYFNEAGELETNPMVAIDIPNVKDISKASDLRSDIASMGKALNQESMAGIRFLPLATNKVDDATAILVRPKDGKISNEDVIKLGNEFGNSMVVSHNPTLGGVVLAPFGEPSGELQIAKSKIKDLFGSDMDIRAGHSNLQKDRFYMPKSDYAKEGARRVPKQTKELRRELKKFETLRYPRPSSPSRTNPLIGDISD